MESFELVPLKKYNPPSYPTYEEARRDRTLLKKLPSRWKKSVGALACVSLLGAASLLGGCGFLLNGCTCSRCGSIHFGGSGTPIYVVYLTEQEAIEVIRNKAESMGLEMKDTPPDISVTIDGRDISLSLFNKENEVAFAHVGAMDSWDVWDQGSWTTSGIAKRAKEAFDAKENDLAVGVFNTWSVDSVCRPTEEERAETLKWQKQQLTAQVRKFIEWLQAEGIIQ